MAGAGVPSIIPGISTAAAGLKKKSGGIVPPIMGEEKIYIIIVPVYA